MPNTLYDALFAIHADNPDPFLHQSDNTALSYRDFIAIAGKLANTLTVLGAKPGDRVLAQVNKSTEALALYAACVQCGCIFIPLNTAYTSKEVAYFISDASPSVVVCDPQAAPAIEPLTEATVVTLGSGADGTLLQAAQKHESIFATVPRVASDIAAILYTSGTTGRSKGAMLTHHNLLSNAQTLVDYWHFTREDNLLHALPIYHTHGLFVATNTIMLCGAAMIFLPKFDVDDMLAHLPQATSMMGVPTFYTRLLADDRMTIDLVSHMRLFISGSAPLLAETHEEFERRTGQKILERYGMTETNMNTSNPYNGDRKAGTVGFALPGIEIKICDPQSGEEINDNEIGMLEVRGPNVFTGYWQMPEKTAEELRDNGFFITGDLATKDADGYLRIVGRDKDLIISGGFNIYPKEIELLLDDCEGVLESAVVAAPHQDFGEGVVAMLVANPGASIDIEEVKSTVAENLAKFKQPKAYQVVTELPRNAMGKVQKNLLREQVKDTFTA